MNEIVAFCGIACNECGAFIATQKDDNEKRAEVAMIWSKQYNSDIKPEDINCDGCQSGGERIFNYCTVCEIRKCGNKKGVANCAQCDDYACAKLEGFFQMVPDSKKRFDEIRASSYRFI
jgi:hypothetical protein